MAAAIRETDRGEGTLQKRYPTCSVEKLAVQAATGTLGEVK
jgi:hypothetical protein